MSSLHIDRENDNATYRMQNTHGAKMTTTGVMAPRVTMRKPLGEVNRMDSRHQGNAKEPLRAKSSQTSGKASVGTKTQLSHKPGLQLQDKEQLRTKEVKTKQTVKVKPEKDICPQSSTEAMHSNDALDDSDIELMYPAPAESEDDFCNWFPASEMALVFGLKRWQLSVSRPTRLMSPPASPPQFAPTSFDTLSDDGKQVWQLSELPELPPMLEDEQDLEYFATLL